ncbi:CoB--CoM heterodisulfide reductase subunit B [Candidatus Woesearchaeota archaeon]|nr:CoB--CoM heterodisulfide reductase subunit B [Candidatus Woesearchaeota archaeon]
MSEEKKEKAEEKTYALFLGCVIPIQIPHIEKLARDLLPKLGINIVDADFSCCPFYGVRDIDEKEWLVTAARNLALAEEQKIDIISLCNGCSQTLIEANHALQDKELRAEINEVLKKINKQYNGTVKVYHFLMVFDSMKDQIKALIKKPFHGLKIATHTGCHLLRPSKIIGFDEPEDPKKFDDFVKLIGANSVDYHHKALCCGYTQVTNEKDMSLDLMKDKLDELNEKRVDALTVCCPSCYLQYDKNQVLIRSKFKVEYKIPVIHALQLLGLAIGMRADEVFLQKNRSITEDFMQKIK